jgi:hypothetical protein
MRWWYIQRLNGSAGLMADRSQSFSEAFRQRIAISNIFVFMDSVELALY